MPDLDFRIESAEVLTYAASPSLVFKLHISNQDSEPIRSIMLKIQIQIVARLRPYSANEEEQLVELFGRSHRWADTMKTMLWANTVVVVPPFSDSAVVDVPVACTYDFDVVSAKYFHALEDGEVPLEFLFSGTIFYGGKMGGLQVTQISWEKEATFRMPARLWQEMMDVYFPNSAWLRLRQDVFDRLYLYKASQGLPTWDETLERLLAERLEAEVAP